MTTERQRPAGAGAAEQTTGSTVARGGAWTLASSLAPQVFILVISVVAARYLGPDGMGRQSYIAFVSLSVTLLLTGGVPVALSRFIGERLGAGHPEEVRPLIRWALRIELVGATLAAAGLIGAGLLGAEPSAAWILTGVGAAAAVLHTVPSAALSGTQRWRAAATFGLSTSLGLVVTVVIVLVAGGGIVGMFAAEAAFAVLGLAGVTVLARRALAGMGAHGRLDSELRRRVLRYAGIGTLNVALSYVVWRRSEFFFLGAYSPDSEIAMYSIAFAAVAAMTKLPEAVGTVLSPAFATLFGAGAVERMRSGYSRALRFVVRIALPLTALALALAPTAIGLVYGEEYRRAGDVLLLLLVTFPVVALVGPSRGLITGFGRRRFPVTVGAFAAAVNIGLDLLLIPDHGAIGAALANSLAQLAGGIPIIAYACYQVRPVRWAPGPTVRALLAAAVAGGLAHLGLQLLGGAPGLVLGGLLGTAAYAALVALLGVLPAEDVRWVSDLASRRDGRLAGLVRWALRHTRANGGTRPD
ncbi:MAG TPA: oligosaccharide flippase family protein [Solirubrobacteraceae bacterium]|nr:oligosaccharide flippase family protein [Solirubrobacteraceae bacterium]